MNKALTIVEPQAQVAVTQKDLDDYLFGTGTKLTEAQKRLFFGIALAQNLNPLKREIYAVAYGSNFNVITGYEVYLKRAERIGLLDGWEATVKGEGNSMVATCTVWRKDRSKPTVIEAWFSEYNTGQSLWKSKPRTMLRKVSIAQAFRMTFPDELGGIPYTSEEIAAGEIQEAEFTPLDKMAEKAAGDDLMDRKQKAIDFLETKGKNYIDDAQVFLNKDFVKWTQKDLDKLKAWAKAGFPDAPKPPDEVQETEPDQGHPEPPEVSPTEAQGPSKVQLVEALAGKGWPVEKLQVKFGKPMADWGEAELKVLADMAAD